MTVEVEAPAPNMIYCNTCGSQMAAIAPACPSCGSPNAAAQPEISSKTFVATLLLCLFLGSFGVHRFYVGKILTGLLMLVTLGGLGIWTLVDLVLIIVGSFKDKNGLPLKR